MYYIMIDVEEELECSFCKRKSTKLFKHIHGSGKLLCVECNCILMKMLSEPSTIARYKRPAESFAEFECNERTLKRRKVERSLNERAIKLKEKINALLQQLEKLISYDKSNNVNQQSFQIEREIDSLFEEVNVFGVHWSRFFSRQDEFVTDADIEAALTKASAFFTRINNLDAKLKDIAFGLEKCPRLQERPLRHFVDAVGSAKAITFVSGDKLLTYSKRGIIRIWNVLEGYMSFELVFHYEIVAIEPLRNALIAISLTNRQGYQTIAILDLEKKFTLRVLNGHKCRVGLLKCLRNGLLVSFAVGDSIKLWNPFSDYDNLLLNIDLHECPLQINTLDSLPNGNLVALGNVLGTQSKPRDVLVWNIKDGQLVKSLTLNQGVTSNMLVLSSGRLAFGFAKGRIKILDLNDAGFLHMIDFAHQKSVFRLAQISERIMLSGGWKYKGSTNVTQLRLWSLNDLSLLQTVETGLGQCTFSLSISPSRRLLAWKDGGDKSIKCWPIEF